MSVSEFDAVGVSLAALSDIQDNSARSDDIKQRARQGQSRDGEQLIVVGATFEDATERSEGARS